MSLYVAHEIPAFLPCVPLLPCVVPWMGIPRGVRPEEDNTTSDTSNRRALHQSSMRNTQLSLTEGAISHGARCLQLPGRVRSFGHGETPGWELVFSVLAGFPQTCSNRFQLWTTAAHECPAHLCCVLSLLIWSPSGHFGHRFMQ